MLTASIYGRAPLLAAPTARILVRDALQTLLPTYGMGLRAWAILDDHYHLLLKTSDGARLPIFLNRLHGGTSRQINLLDGAVGRTVWYSYWDTCIRDERGLWTRFNYIHYNPVKHGYVAHPSAWPHSSYHYYLRTRGETWLREMLARYPVQAAEMDAEEG